MLSDKYKQRREESLSKSQERKSYYAQVEDHRDHTYLSRLGENNRDALEVVRHNQSQSKSYFNDDLRSSRFDKPLVSSRSGAIAAVGSAADLLERQESIT
jgi:hypothetical protein